MWIFNIRYLPSIYNKARIKKSFFFLVTIFTLQNFTMSVTDVLSGYDERIAALAVQLREFVLAELNDITELPDASANIIGYGYGTGYKNLICTILLSKKGVKLGFYKGIELPDPQKLLAGTGKIHRFAEINTVQDIKNPALKKLLDDALNAYRKRVK